MVYQVSAVALDDVNGDGAVDIITSRDDTSEMTWIDVSSGSAATLATSGVFGASLLHDDYSGDGVHDVVVGGPNGLAIRRGIAPVDPLRLTHRETFSTPQYFGYLLDAASGDFDGDGDSDFLAVWKGIAPCHRLPRNTVHLGHTSGS